MKTLPTAPRPYNRWKAETLSFLHVLLVWGVSLTSLINEMRQSWTIHLKQTVDRISEWADKEKAVSQSPLAVLHDNNNGVVVFLMERRVG